jgi:hypothetical protein
MKTLIGSTSSHTSMPTRHRQPIESVRLNPTFVTPRHRHVYDQIRYVVEGELKYGDRRHTVGDFLYFPEATWYGPQEGQHVKLVDIQFTGPSGIPYLDQDALALAREELALVGTFDAGVYTYADGRTQDSYVALTEYITGKPVEYPPARYDDYLVIHSNEFPWIPSTTNEGVMVRHLGAFNETGPDVKMLKPPRVPNCPLQPFPTSRRASSWMAAWNAAGEISGISFTYIRPTIRGHSGVHRINTARHHPGHIAAARPFCLRPQADSRRQIVRPTRATSSPPKRSGRRWAARSLHYNLASR